VRRLAAPAVLVLLAAGCASLTPAQQESAAEVRALADRTAQLYGLSPIRLLVSRNPKDPPGSYRRGFFTVSTITLTSTFRDAIVAHELSHHVLGHEAALHGNSAAEVERAYQQRELEANAKAVEILVRAAGFSEERALRTLYDYLAGVQWALDRYPRLDLRGHKLPCEEIADLLGRFPRQRVWTASLECAPTGAGSGGYQGGSQ
jgi:IrrE N-terminal-like domain